MKKLSFLLGFLLLLSCPALFAAEPDQLYQKGLQAYNAENYLAASEHLFAYRQMAGTGLSADFLRQVNEALKYAEAQVHVAIETKRELDEHGVVTEVTVESSGKADAPGSSHTKTEPFHPPSGNKGPKPGLPSKPAVIMGGKLIVGKLVAPTPGIIVPGEKVKPEKMEETKEETKEETLLLEKELEQLKRRNEFLVDQLKRCRMGK